MKTATTIATALLMLCSLSACDDKERVCEPRTIRADPYNPGAYRLCNGDGTDEEKYQGPVPTNSPIKA